jgi:exonuclease SbcC
VRPLELTLAGFRSYRAERIVSFRDMDLVAIIGDTGAGKSSLLEAMTWALYGASTWSQKCNAELLAHNARRMSVALEFESGGERYRVTRTYARSGGGSAELACLSDPAGFARVDGVRQVDPAIVALIGLEYDVFCSCVLLPQGKFERLLKARKADRTDTLKSILRLEQLQETRELADRQATLLIDRERELLLARGRFRPDPAGDAAAASAELAAVEPELERLDAISRDVAARTRRAAEEVAQAREASGAAERLGARRGARGAQLRALVPVAEDLARVLAGAQAQVVRAAGELADAEAEHAVAAAAGLDAAGLAAHAERLDRLRATLRRRSELAERRRAGEEALAAARDALGGARRAFAGAAEALQAHDEAQAAARTRREAAARSAGEAAAAAEALEAAVAAEAAAAREAQGAADSAAAWKRRHADARGALAAATAAQAEATAVREAVLRAQSAAHAAADCAPGDPCPVCTRELPAAFAAAPAPDLDDAQAACVAAAARVAAAAEAERDAMLQARVAAAAATQTHAAVRDARATLGDAADPAAALAGARRAAEAAAAQADGAAAVAERLAGERAGLDAERTRRAEARARAEADVGAAERTVADRASELAAVADELARGTAALPAFCALAADPALLDGHALDAAEAALAERRTAARTLGERLRGARDGERQAGEAARDAELAHQREVVTPLASAREALLLLAGELPERFRDGLPAAPAAATPEAAAPAALAAWAEAVEARADAAVAAMRDAAARAAEAAQAEIAGARAAIAAAGHADEAGLETAVDHLRAAALAATRERDAARRQLADVERLDALLARAAELREGFQALKAALGDGAFVGFVVARRQRALLAHASRVLEDITGRYAFTEDFRILDRESGLPRSPETLSGGETFIASLALALGLVEIADRTGGALRALFLDEGFGSLDAGILDTALTALEERAKAGRLIGLISHVPTVAERIDTVMEVRHAVDGSTIGVLTPAERASRVFDDVAAAIASSS